jgi:hypothetical protein
MARRIIDGEGEYIPPDSPFPEEDIPPSPPPDPPVGSSQRLADIIEARFRWIEAVDYWQVANAESAAQRFGNAEIAYEESQKAVVRYFQKFYTSSPLNLNFNIAADAPTAAKIGAVVTTLFDAKEQLTALWAKVRRRREAITLSELQKPDWHGFSATAEGLLKLTPQETETPEQSVARQESLDYFALLLATVFIPLARAEMNRSRRNFNSAISEYMRLLQPYRKPVSGSPMVWLTCDFIERPFILLSLGETRMDKAEAQFKAASQGSAAEARTTYQSIHDSFLSYGFYAARVASAQQALAAQAAQPVGSGTTASDLALQVLGKDITVPGIKSKTRELPGLSQTKAPAESWLQLQDNINGEAIAETNPRIYALLLSAQARLIQIDNGFNYLGYKDDYIPPWRFQFLLERARYFSGHAKNAQRDYLNFLSNAEREEFQEQSAEQAVEIEKDNVRIETARVEQVQAEVAAARESWKLAKAVAANAQGRFTTYSNMDQHLRKVEGDFLRSSTRKSIFNMALGVVTENPVLALNSFLDFTGTTSEKVQVQTARVQRSYEKFNLSAAISETAKAADIAEKQYKVAQAGFTVSCLQRQAALLRHEFAIQNLQYLRNRALNAEQWFRLANAIRGVADTYLRYAIELAFLCEQAYEFEADKRINAIRFDYDQSEVGAYLAADFLMSDLDTIEQDFIVNQRQRQQQVRYVLSMAREFPAALEELRETGRVNFVLRLEQIEKRFPGLYNARVGMVDVLPVALLDSTRFSLDLTHLGTSQMRIKGQPDVPIGVQSQSVFNVSDLPAADYDWTKTPKELWPVKILVNEPETAVFSGLSRQDAASAFPVASSGQRNAFEGRGLAGGWQIDLSSRENQLVPGSLTDLLITFTVSGYHDSDLRSAIDSARQQTTALTSYLSARQNFPDAFYDFTRTGRMVWGVPREMLALNGDLGRLRNIGMSVRPGATEVHFSRLMTRLRVNLRVEGTGETPTGVTLLTMMPEISVTQTGPMTVFVRAAMSNATELSWDFGDGTPILRTAVSNGQSAPAGPIAEDPILVGGGSPGSLQTMGSVETIGSGPMTLVAEELNTTLPIAPAEGVHTYARPGRYVMKLRCVRDDSMSEFRISIVVSRSHKLGDPLIIYIPGVTFDTTTKRVSITTGGAVQQAGRMVWRVGNVAAEGNAPTFALKPGLYTVDFAAVRRLNFRAYGSQRYVKGLAPLPLQGLSAMTNRTFDMNGNETNGIGTPVLPPRNELAKRLFDKGAISPEDDWTFELLPEEILGLPAGTAVNGEALDLSDVDDVVLSMEYDVTPGL